MAAQDVTERGHSGLASYYSAKGESPGVWLGSGIAGLEGLSAGDVVTEEQMRNLFGSGRHPLAEQLRTAAAESGLDVRDQDQASWLGKLYAVHTNDVSQFRLRVAQRVSAINVQRGLRHDAPGTLQDRARIRTEVAVELFREEFGRAPADAREIAATIAKHSRPRTTAVAGYDLTFSPVKSVSTLWAIADKPTAAAIERAHQQAVKDALTYLENSALFTREGAQGIRQVETRGLIATAFTHRDSRAGDPDLHTHVAVANKVYVAVVDDRLRRETHAPTVGILLCATRNDTVVRYALANTNAPMAVAGYTSSAVDPTQLHLPQRAEIEALLATPIDGDSGTTFADQLP